MERGKYRGFTVFEMLAVLTIIGVVLAFTASSLNDFRERMRLRGAIEIIGAHLRQARWDARLKSTLSEVVFDVENGSYTINGTQTAALPRGIRFGADPSVTGKPGQPYSPPPADGISFNVGRSRNAARFYASGMVVPTGSVFITNGRETMAVTVAITGRPKLWRSHGGRKWESF